jgi:hypothetical protein
MSRPNLGVEHVDKLAGERETKTRLKVILRTLTGELAVNDAAEQIGVRPSRFHELRDEALMGALDALAPKPPGRPPSACSVSQRELDLAEALDAARYQLDAERVRTQLLLSIPEVVLGKAKPSRLERGDRGGAGSRTRR